MFQNGPKDGIEGQSVEGKIIPSQPVLISIDNFQVSEE